MDRKQKKALTILSILSILGFLGVFLFLYLINLMFGIRYYRITEGPLYDKYMSKRYKKVHINVKEESVFCVGKLENRAYVFSPYVFVSISKTAATNWKKGKVFESYEEKVYEIIDLYEAKSFPESSNVAICIIQGVPELEDIVFEKMIEDEVIAYGGKRGDRQIILILMN